MAKKTVKTAAPANAKKTAPVAKAALKKTSTAKKGIDNAAISKKAEEIYHARIVRGEHGTAEGDWHLAEKLLHGGKKPVVKKPAVKKK